MVEATETRMGPAKAVELGNAVAIASGKGGVGKTWLSITLCHALARTGRKALLFDGDLGLANVDIQLGLAPRRDLGGVLAGRIRLHEAVSAYREGGFDIVAGRSGTGSLANLPAERLAGLAAELAQLGPAYDHVILDLGAGVERTVRQLATRARTCLVMTTDEPTAMTDAYAFIKLMRLQKPEADLRVVVNLAASEHEGERTYATLRKACESFLGVVPPLAGIVRHDARVKDSIRHQAPLLVRHPNTEAAADIEALARRLLETP
ncbi:MAG: MinD/ParA family protein [Gemmatimonadetes bacterium]|uniref:MinD/ParA family protein n=1 Tax=Candidatus Kutchimonas denitrificans TaxID=3056748 RepID=A0AAE5CD03_9BACT|nr:MinD/ParA family protein [Candidatus Kutchimonas denitrificans]